MLCEDCHEREASVVVTTVINGESTSRNLCRECVKKYQKGGDVSALLAAILSSMYKAREDGDKRCASCGMTLSEFRKGGMLGCASCYKTFRGELTPMITKIQGRTEHAGKRPKQNAEAQERQARIEHLRKAMETAVSEEAFEEAARLRDELNALRKAEKQERAEEGERQ